MVELNQEECRVLRTLLQRTQVQGTQEAQALVHLDKKLQGEDPATNLESVEEE